MGRGGAAGGGWAWKEGGAGVAGLCCTWEPGGSWAGKTTQRWRAWVCSDCGGGHPVSRDEGWQEGQEGLRGAEWPVGQGGLLTPPSWRPLQCRTQPPH